LVKPDLAGQVEHLIQAGGIHPNRHLASGSLFVDAATGRCCAYRSARLVGRAAPFRREMRLHLRKVKRIIRRGNQPASARCCARPLARSRHF
jgi:hypothetical protein